MVNIAKEIVFLNEFARNVGEFDADIFGMIEGIFELEFFDVKLMNSAPGQERMLLT